MELLFVFIDELNCLKKEGLDFGGQFLFQYSPSDAEITIKENPFWQENFFSLYPENQKLAEIKGVSAIVGQNGAGKTSILKYLIKNFVSGTSGVSMPMVVAFIDQNGKRMIYHSQKFPIERGNWVEYDFSLHLLVTTPVEIPGIEKALFSTHDKIEAFGQTDFIYFSNIFHLNNTDFTLSGSYDLSTDYLIRDDLRHNLENALINNQLNQQQVEVHIQEDISRQIDFLNSGVPLGNVPIRTPDRLYVSTKRDVFSYDYGFGTFEKNALQEYRFEEVFIELQKMARSEYETSVDLAVKAEIWFISAAFFNFLLETATNFRAISSHFHFQVKGSLSEGDRPFKQVALEVLDDLGKQSVADKNINLGTDFIIRIKALKDFFEILHGLIAETPYFVTDHPVSFNFDIRGGADSFLNFHNIYQQTFTLKPYLNFNWRNISSGEKAMLNFYSRFYSLSDHSSTKRGIQLRQNLIILIDEGDVFLHPEWQRIFLKAVLEFLPRLFGLMPDGRRRKIQLILTTNSPIPISDLPSANVILLERNGLRTIVKDSLDDQRQTFGANIHALLNDSFFLTNGFIGDFAREKINNVISLLQKDIEEIYKNQHVIERTINLIGEPVVKSKLLQMYEDRISANQGKMDERVRRLEQEVSELKKRLPDV